ncbi:MAG: ATP synthase F1 subunit gamma [Candidatus Acidiferrales bacterium]
MPTLLDFRRRIRSIKNTQQITRAMKFVAAAKLRRAQENVLAARPYAHQMVSLMRSAMARIENPTHPLMARRAEKRVRLLVVTGDKGLCGAFNTNVLRRSLEFLREHEDLQIGVVPIGKKGRDALRKRRATLVDEYVGIFMRLNFANAKEITEKLVAGYSAKEIDAVYVVYNEFKSVLAQKLTVDKLLPIDAGELAGSEPAGGDAARTALNVDYIYEQPAQEVLNRLLPRYVETQVYRYLLESAAAEYAARMTAMDAATSNAGELIDKLTLHMNKVRQAAITKEIIEVVSGAAAAQ